MTPLANLIHGSGLSAGLKYLASGGKAGAKLEAYLKGQLPGFSSAEYATAARYVEQNRAAVVAANALTPSGRLAASIVPPHPNLGLDAASGERYRVIIDVEFKPTESTPNIIRRTYWHGPSAPTGRDLKSHVHDYLENQLDVWGNTPGSKGDDDDVLDIADALVGYTVVQVNKI